MQEKDNDLINVYFKKLVGRVLRIIEASIADKEQRNSLKNLLEQEIYSIKDGLTKEKG